MLASAQRNRAQLHVHVHVALKNQTPKCNQLKDFEQHKIHALLKILPVDLPSVELFQ